MSKKKANKKNSNKPDSAAIPPENDAENAVTAETFADAEEKAAEDAVATESSENVAEEKAETPKKKNNNVLFSLLIVFFVCAFMFGGYMLYKDMMEYEVASSEYDAIEKDFVEVKAPAATEETNDEALLPFPDLVIDFEGLEAKNEDFLAWLYMPVLEISYPIVQGEDNEKYLDVTFEGQYASSGAIFMDAGNMPGFSDYNTFLYGHNMRNGTMFGDLKKFRRDDTLCDKDPYFYIYKANGQILKYRIFAYYETSDTSDSYATIRTTEEYDAYIKKIKSRSYYKSDADLSNYSPMVVLSTCSGTTGDRRFLVHGVLESLYYIGVPMEDVTLDDVDQLTQEEIEAAMEEANPDGEQGGPTLTTVYEVVDPTRSEVANTETTNPQPEETTVSEEVTPAPETPAAPEEPAPAEETPVAPEESSPANEALPTGEEMPATP